MATFTQRELEISNKSYTNKDFESVYLELLSTAEKISTRFSPTSANEADPFISLLKLVAAVTDKVNYNVDKNILERFLLSCTQEQSMRQLTQYLGYKMRGYQSAETTVVFKVNFNSIDAEQAEGDDPIAEVDIPIYSIVTDGDSIQYITLEATSIPRASGISKEIPVIQGKLKELTVLGKNVIQLENLDSNNRIYFPELMVAENGISVNLASLAETWQAWTASANLNTETFGSLVYQVGFDSTKNLPFIEFPEWIADVIGDGLSIKYVITDGAAGNVAARALTTVSRTGAAVKIDDNLISVVNSSAATSGAEPETLDEAYKGFKKVIGTFDTLVTCRDYANKIYELLNRYGTPFVSNVQVGDRRSDINYSTEVVTATKYGMQTNSSIGYKYDVMWDSSTFDSMKTDLEKNFELNKIYYVYDTNTYYQCREVLNNKRISERMLLTLQESELEPVITPSEICLYPLKPIENFTYLGVDDVNGYNQSYNLIRDKSQLEDIKSNLNNSKTMSHLYKDIPGDSIGYIRSDYRLDATVNTIQKVNAFEQSEILVNINNALIQKYNPRNLAFGSEIAFDELLTTIEKADSRIKSVSLQEPEQCPVIVKMNNDTVNLVTETGEATDSFKFIVAKNILAGRVEVFKYDTDFEYDFFQKDARKYANMVKVSTYANLPVFSANSADVEYTLNENEAVQFLAPLLKTEITYPYGINYYLYLASGHDYIPKDSEYRLATGDLLIFSYIDNNDETVINVYEGSADSLYIFKPNFDFYTTAARERDGDTPTKVGVKNAKYTYENYSFYTLMTNHTVECKKILSEKLITPKRCYWLTNQPHNKILWQQELDAEDNPTNYFTYILEDGEYFFYADTSLTSLFAFGAGTKLKIYAANTTQVLDQNGSSVWTHDNYIDVNQITENGLASLAAYFTAQNFDANYLNLEIFENEIITLTAGDVMLVSSSDEFKIENNIFINLPETVTLKYKFKSAEDEAYTELPDRSTLVSADAGWKCRALLDLNCGPDKEQILVNNQKIEFIPGTFDEQSRRWVAFTDINAAFTGGNIVLDASQQSGADLLKFKSSVPITRGGGLAINLEYMDLDLQYKCPSILIFKDITNTSKLSKVGEDYFSLNFGIDAAIQVIPADPEPNTTLTITQANEIGLGKAHNTYTSGKYYVTGTILSIDPDKTDSTQLNTYGNMTITDADGNTLYIYGLYNSDGTVRFDKMEPQPAIGDIITVLGIIGNYNDNTQMKNGWVTAVNPEDPEEPGDELIGDEITLTVGAGQIRITQINVFYRKVLADGQYEPSLESNPVGLFKSISIADYAALETNNWQNATQYSNVDILIDPETQQRCIYATAVSDGNNTGKYYTSGQQWRFYNSDNGKLIIKSENNYIIDKVQLAYSIYDGGTLLLNGQELVKGQDIPVHEYPSDDPDTPDDPEEPETPSVDLRNTYRAKNSAVLYTAAADAKQFESKAIGARNLPSVTFSEVNIDVISQYFNNKVYKKAYDNDTKTQPAGWYKCVYTEKATSALNATDVHDPTAIGSHDFKWECLALADNVTSLKPSPRLFMIYLDNLDGADDNILNVEVIQKKVFLKTKSGQAGLKLFNSLDTQLYSSIELTSGVNIIEIADSLTATTKKINEDYTEEFEIEAMAEIKGFATEDELKTLTEDTLKEGAKTALTSISILISKLKLNKGLNPILGLSESDNIIDYLKTYFYKQFSEFFINAEFEQAKLLDISEDYPLSSAHAFYDVNNVVNQWTLPKIDFPNSSIRIARTSKK